jgi:hypothetical protein
LEGPSSPRFTTTANGLFAVPSVITLPPELPVSVTAPPDVNSTKFETVAFIVTDPVVCADAITAVIVISAVITSAFKTPFVGVNMSLLLYGWG